MADSADAPDWFGNLFNNWILMFLESFVIGLFVGLGGLLNLFGVNDTFAAIGIDLAKDFLPPLVKEKWDAEKTADVPKAWYTK